MMIREPIVAGSFYPAAAEACRASLNGCLERRAAATGDGRIVGGVVPHAGWMCSGGVAGAVFSAIAEQGAPETVVLFGAVHQPRCVNVSAFVDGRWETPLGCIDIDHRLGERVLGHTNLIVSEPYAHEAEHSIEVQVPFIQHLFPNAKLLPIMVPPNDRAPEVGRAVGGTLEAYGCRAVVLASTDLTHYGPRYGFTPMGVGDKGLAWAKDVNDRRQIDRMLAMDAEGVIPEARQHRNACGSGAVAAAIAASQAMGARSGVLLEHTTSREVLGPEMGDDAVGYAGVVFVARRDE